MSKIVLYVLAHFYPLHFNRKVTASGKASNTCICASIYQEMLVLSIMVEIMCTNFSYILYQFITLTSQSVTIQLMMFNSLSYSAVNTVWF